MSQTRGKCLMGHGGDENDVSAKCLDNGLDLLAAHLVVLIHTMIHYQRILLLIFSSLASLPCNKVR
jgi:hypothetical protein